MEIEVEMKRREYDSRNEELGSFDDNIDIYIESEDKEFF